MQGKYAVVLTLIPQKYHMLSCLRSFVQFIRKDLHKHLKMYRIRSIKSLDKFRVLQEEQTMELQFLREFIYLTKYLNFRLAANHLYIAQPVLSRHIIQMEHELGVKLFIRDKHSVQLTAIGKLFLEEAKGIIARYDDGMNNIKMAISGLAGQLRIGFLEAAVNKFFPSLVLNFQQAYPNIELHLAQYNSTTLANAIELDNVDVGFMLSLNISNKPILNSKKVCTDSFCVVFRHDHPLADKSKINLSELAHETYIIKEPTRTYDHLHKLCELNGFTPKTVERPPFPENVLLMVETGIGIAILARQLEIYSRPSLRFIDIEGDCTSVDVVASWKKDNTNPAIPIFLNELDLLR